MSHQFTLSKKGRRLIKAFEGFRPVDRSLVTGQRIVGYGHKVRRPEAMSVTRAEANELLRDDLAPYEDMINTKVHAPLTQNQFDALVSLAFSLGPKAFLNAPTLHLLNNGRPLDAAKSFELWCKSHIHGKTYLVDALVRRRAQEKALFLRPETGVVQASRLYLKPVEDIDMRSSIMDSDLPVFEDADHGYVSQVPYDATDDLNSDSFENEPVDYDTSEGAQTLAVPMRRREDGPAGILTLSEIIDDDDYSFDEDMAVDEPIDIDDIVLDDEMDTPSPIAVAAAEVSDRLDALIDTGQPAIPEEITAWPESLITPEAPDVPIESEIVESSVVSDASDANTHSGVEELVETEKIHLGHSDAVIPETGKSYSLEGEAPRGLGPYLVMIVTGLTLIGASLGAILRGGTTRLGEAMPFWASLALIFGVILVFFALYYVVKSIARRT